MKLAQSLSLTLAIAALGLPAWTAAQDDPHQHPAEVAPTPASDPAPGKSSFDTTRMDTQLKAMREMHDEIMAAKTPQERNALMTEQMKVMQEGMNMMNAMFPDGMKDMMGMKGDMAAHHRMMGKRMEMMQAMMQMMMDRLSVISTQ